MKNISKALVYVSEIHKNQRRKDKEKTPYINHLIDTMNILVESGIKDENVLIAALLHDSIEDIKISYQNLKNIFNEEVANLVLECTDDKTLEKSERKLIQIRTITHKSKNAQLIKIADKISNLKSLIRNPPKGWNKDRIAGYIFWSKKVVLPVLDINEKMKNEFYQVFNELIEYYDLLKDDNDLFFNYYIELIKKTNV